jgi:hypothetical protein
MIDEIVARHLNEETFYVTAEYGIQQGQYEKITVTASSREDARKKAEKILKKKFPVEWPRMRSNITIDSSEVKNLTSIGR